jgi:hypothetical protein
LATLVGRGLTVRVAFPVKPSAVAWIPVVPFLRPWTRPEALTEATVGSVLVQVMVAPVMGFPFLSSMIAEYCCVSPMASMMTLPGATTIRNGTGAEVESPQEPRRGRRRRKSPGVGNRAFISIALAPAEEDGVSMKIRFLDDEMAPAEVTQAPNQKTPQA